MSSESGSFKPQASASPVVITDASWYRLADDLAVVLASAPQGLVWLVGGRGAGKTAWLQALLPSLRTDFMVLNMRRREQVQEASEQLAARPETAEGPPPALILDNLSPSELMALVAEPAHPARELVPGYPGPVMLLSPEYDDDKVAARRLERLTGRSLMRHELPASSLSQNHSVLVAHQTLIEKRWQVEITEDAMEFAVAGLRYRVTPGQAVEWMERAAARVSVVAEEGPRECRRLRSEIQILEQRIHRRQQQGEPCDELEVTRDTLTLELTASEVDWLERQAAGTLTRVLPSDLREELESLTGRGDYPDLPLSSVTPDEGFRERTGNLRT